MIKLFHSGVQNSLTSGNRQTAQDNLTPAERQALTSLSERKDIIIKPADKGSAVVIMTKKDYDGKALRQLSKMTRYERLSKDPTTENYNKIINAINELLANKSINANTARDLRVKEPRAAGFYILPKVHKSLTSPPGRPIVSSNGCPTKRLSAFVDVILKPLVAETPSFLRDTKQLLTEISSPPAFPPHALLVTMEVVGLYSNIPLNL